MEIALQRIYNFGTAIQNFSLLFFKELLSILPNMFYVLKLYRISSLLGVVCTMRKTKLKTKHDRGPPYY